MFPKGYSPPANKESPQKPPYNAITRRFSTATGISWGFIRPAASTGAAPRCGNCLLGLSKCRVFPPSPLQFPGVSCIMPLFKRQCTGKTPPSSRERAPWLKSAHRQASRPWAAACSRRVIPVIGWQKPGASEKRQARWYREASLRPCVGRRVNFWRDTNHGKGKETGICAAHHPPG